LAGADSTTGVGATACLSVLDVRTILSYTLYCAVCLNSLDHKYIYI
jgi:hypothetical protein